MKILALDFSPTQKEYSLTHMLLRKLADGMVSAGANVEIVKVSKTENNVDPCVGCLQCWTVTLGECKTIKDHMSKGLFQKWKNADLVVYATPIYNQFMTAAMKSFIERLQPAGDIGNFRGKSKAKYPDTVLLATATYYGKEEFSFLSQYMHGYYAEEKNTQIIAELFRPQVKVLGTNYFPKFKNRVLNAFETAGNELVKHGSVSSETMHNLTCDLTDQERFNKLLLLINRSIIKNNMTTKVFMKRQPPLDITSIDNFVILSDLLLENAYFPEGALRNFLFQLNFPEGSCNVTVGIDGISVNNGSSNDPNVLVNTSLEKWMSIMRGETNFKEVFAQQNINIIAKNDADQHYFIGLMSTIVPQKPTNQSVSA